MITTDKATSNYVSIIYWTKQSSIKLKKYVNFYNYGVNMVRRFCKLGGV